MRHKRPSFPGAALPLFVLMLPLISPSPAFTLASNALRSPFWRNDFSWQRLTGLVHSDANAINVGCPSHGILFRATFSTENRRPTNRWTRAAGACFASRLVRRCLNEIAPPRQLRRWAAIAL
jgi:hypothetical protein